MSDPEIKYKIGDFVYLITDIDQYKRIVTGITIRLNSVIYAITFGENETTHYDFEISKEPNLTMKE